MKYVETKNEEPFDWNKFLNKENISVKEWNEATELATDWVTCACGNLCAIIPRNVDGMPMDETLRYLGICFTGAIENKLKGIAKNYLHKIEERSQFIIDRIRDEYIKDLGQSK